jgi:gas vesicle protein
MHQVSHRSAKDDNQASGGINPLVAGAVGAAVGAAAALFSDSRNRQKAMEILEETVNRARASAEDAKQIAADTLSNLEESTDKVRREASDAAPKKIKEASEKLREETEKK